MNNWSYLRICVKYNYSFFDDVDEIWKKNPKKPRSPDLMGKRLAVHM